MKKMRNIVMLLMAVMVLATLTPNTAEAAKKKPKKTLTVETYGWKHYYGNKASVSDTQMGSFVVRYNGKRVTEKAKYKSSNKKVITVKKDGFMYLKKLGKSTITIKYKGMTKKIKITVTKPKFRVGKCGETADYTKTPVVLKELRGYGEYTPESQSVSTDDIRRFCTYKSSDPSVVSVSKTGALTAKKNGKARITITIKKKYKVYYNVIVQAKVPETKPESKEHKHDWVPHTKEVTSYVEDGVETIQDYADEEVEVYVCGCGERVEGDASAHIKAHEGAGEVFEGRTETEVRQVPAGTHTVSKGHYETFKTTDYWTCSGCGETIR